MGCRMARDMMEEGLKERNIRQRKKKKSGWRENEWGSDG